LANVLIVVAHPDDEVLGCGATGASLAAAGHSVRSCFVCGNAEARVGRPDRSGLDRDMRMAQHILGFGDPIVGTFPNLRLNTVPHLDLVQFIERALIETNASILFTHHPGDVNDDHVHVSRACQAAARLPQRRLGVPALERIYFMEVASSSDWAYPQAAPRFDPDTFVSVGSSLELKHQALAAYSGVMRPYPHPRCELSVRALATVRGSQSGVGLAEAFQTAQCAGTVESLFARVGH